MSRTHKTNPTWVKRARGMKWNEITFSWGPALKFGRREYWGRERMKERNDIAQHREPAPSRPRNSVHWDMF